MSCLGFEPTIPVFERAETAHALYRATTVIGIKKLKVELQNSDDQNTQEHCSYTAYSVQIKLLFKSKYDKDTMLQYWPIDKTDIHAFKTTYKMDLCC
jgi:hypothetical protein